MIFAVVLCSAVVAAANLDHRTERDRATAWAAAHHNAVPATLAALAAYPGEYRDALVASLSPAEKSRLWQEQFAAVLANETLNQEQQAFIRNMQVQATPASFEPGAEHPEACPDVARLFTDPDLRLKVRRLGTATVPQRSWGATYVSAIERVRAAVRVSADTACNCEGWGLCDCGFTACKIGNCAVGGTCGCIWTGPCEGICQMATSSLKKQ